MLHQPLHNPTPVRELNSTEITAVNGARSLSFNGVELTPRPMPALIDPVTTVPITV